MPAVLYKDIARKANDIVNDDYEFNRTLKVKTTTANGVAFTTEGSMGANKSILAKLSGGFKHSSGIHFKKLQVTTHGRVIGEAAADNVLVDGLKMTLKVEDGSSKNAAGAKYKQVGKLGAEFKTKSFSTTAEADFTNNALSATGVFAYENFLLGGQAALSIDKSSLSDHNGALSYVGKDFNVSLVTKKKCSVLSASFDHKANSNTSYAAILDHDIKAQTNALTVGGRYVQDKDTTYCGKVNSDGFVSLSCVQTVRPQVALTTSVNVDVKNIEGESHKFGLGLTLG